jgi:hypothetical protein
VGDHREDRLERTWPYTASLSTARRLSTGVLLVIFQTVLWTVVHGLFCDTSSGRTQLDRRVICNRQEHGFLIYLFMKIIKLVVIGEHHEPPSATNGLSVDDTSSDAA